MHPDPQTGGPRLWSGQDGTMRASYEITADTVRFMSGGRGDDSGGSFEESAQGGGRETPQEEDDIPF